MKKRAVAWWGDEIFIRENGEWRKCYRLNAAAAAVTRLPIYAIPKDEVKQPGVAARSTCLFDPTVALQALGMTDETHYFYRRTDEPINPTILDALRSVSAKANGKGFYETSDGPRGQGLIIDFREPLSRPGPITREMATQQKSFLGIDSLPYWPELRDDWRPDTIAWTEDHAKHIFARVGGTWYEGVRATR